MEYLPLAFIGGVLTLLAPCVLPVLPVILGGSLADANRARPYVVTFSLAISLVLFSLLLKASTLLIGVPLKTWALFSGGIVLLYGLTLLLPQLWEGIAQKFKLSGTSQGWLQKSGRHKGLVGMALIGMALGPVFASCSPAFFLIIGPVLQESWFWGVVNLMVYALSLSGAMLLIALTGRRFMPFLGRLADPKSWFKRILGGILVLVGLAIMLGLDKKAEAWIISQGYFGITQLERDLVNDKK